MRIEPIFLRSKIARRFFGLFIVSALIPVGLLAFFSYQQINTLSYENTQKYLRQAAKDYGGKLYTRLELIDKALTQITLVASQNPANLHIAVKQFNHYFSAISVTNRSLRTTMLLGKEQLTIPLLSDLEKAFLTSGKTLILTKLDINNLPLIYMLRSIKIAHSDALVVVSIIDQQFLWGNSDTEDLRFAFCVSNKNGFNLFCSVPNIKDLLTASLSFKQNDVRQNESPFFVNSWSLYLKPHYFLPKLNIIFAQDKRDALASLNTFKSIFTLVILFSLLSVALISVYLIRRFTTPLESLMDGIARISNDNFKQPVPVTSQDEFGLLATSFNSMAGRISNQLDVLTALAEIDQLILTRLKIEDILDVILTRTHKIIPSDLVSIALVDKDHENQFISYTSYLNKSNKVKKSQCSINHKEIVQLTVPWIFQSVNKKFKYPDYLKSIVKHGVHCFLVLPIVIDKKLNGILMLGFLKKTFLSDNDKGWARNYADRITVALSNAAWEETLYYQAHYDVLTHLPNRQLLNDRLHQALLQAKQENSKVALFFIDLDRFKSVNDSLGHTIGDRLLKEIAQRLQNHLREGDSVARMGGDEFIVVLPNIDQGDFAATQTVRIAEKLLDGIAQPLALEGHDIRITASIGIVIFPDDGTNIDILIKNADAAMYHAKDKGKGNYQFYSEELNASTLKRLLLESDLIGAVDRHEFELYYQPKVDASTGKMLGAEALIRWNHPTKGLVPPFEFIPMVEETSLIITIGEWVIRTACFQNKTWQQQGEKFILVAVNVAIKQLLHPGFVENVSRALSDSKLDPRWLELEITESSAMENMKETLVVLHQLKELGVSLSIDDYGTGYSSLQYMKDFPADVLKIDQSFIFNLLTSPKDVAIVQSTIALAHNFGLKVIAEGVETIEHQKYLAELGCDELQGYLFSRPLPVEEFIFLLKDL